MYKYAIKKETLRVQMICSVWVLGISIITYIFLIAQFQFSLLTIKQIICHRVYLNIKIYSILRSQVKKSNEGVKKARYFLILFDPTFSETTTEWISVSFM